jgi:hypothetical protein
MTALTRPPLAAIFLAASLTAAGAQNTKDHEAHHPAGATPPASEATAPSMGKAGDMPMVDMSGMMDGGMGRMMGMMGPMSAGGDGSGTMPFAHLEGRIAFLKAELAITDAQLPQWNAFADALRASAKDMREAMANVMQSGMPAAAPGRADAMVGMMTARLEGVKKTAAAAKALYATLSDAQKATADELCCPFQ